MDIACKLFPELYTSSFSTFSLHPADQFVKTVSHNVAIWKLGLAFSADLFQLRDHWRFCRDSDFAKAYMKKAQDISHGLSQPKVPRLCQHCQKRDILATGFHLIDTVPDLQRRVNECDFCKLLLEACMDSKQSGSFELHREGSTIVMPGVTKPILSLVYDLGKLRSLVQPLPF